MQKTFTHQALMICSYWGRVSGRERYEKAYAPLINLSHEMYRHLAAFRIGILYKTSVFFVQMFHG